MPFSHMKFDDQEVAILQAAVDQSCTQLGVSRSDSSGRECIAKAIIVLANAGQFSFDKLITDAIAD